MKTDLKAGKRNSEMNCEIEKMIVKFYPFAFYRIERFSEYLTRMYHSGYKISKILFGFILLFETVIPKETKKCVILTRYFHRNMKREKWNDADFMKSRNPRFNKGNGFLFDVYKTGVSVLYGIYLTGTFKPEDLDALKQHRKKRIAKINALKITEFIIIVAGFCLVAYDIFIK